MVTHLLNDTVLLSRIQFALTAMFHIIWPLLSIGLSWFLVTVEALWLKTRDQDYYRLARFWSKILLLNFAIGVISGLPLEFEFGTNWAPLSRMSGDFLGNILGFEGAMAFMLEAGFIGIMAFGWKRVPAGMHLLATTMVAVGASLSAVWIMVANAWMQVPLGGHLQNGLYVVDNYLKAIFNQHAWLSVAHMWLASVETSLFVIGGISAWYLLKTQHTAVFLKSFKLVLMATVVVVPLQIWMGDLSGQAVFEHQPAKGAAIEGFWNTNKTGEGADWSLLAWPDKTLQKNDWAVSIPDGLSLLATHQLHGKVQGLRDFPLAEQPPALPMLFYAFRLMVAVGIWFFIILIASARAWQKGFLTQQTISQQKYLLLAWITAIPMAYLAVESGWIVREVGRQPWVIYGLLKTSAAASILPASTVLTTLILYALFYLVILGIFFKFVFRIIKQGPPEKLQGDAGDSLNGAAQRGSRL